MSLARSIVFYPVSQNAGISHKPTPLEDFSLETFQNVVNANLIGPFLCTREAFKVFKAQSPQGGRIINNGSIAAHAPRPCATAYTTTKHAITGLTKSASLDGRRHNITCTQIDIGEHNSVTLDSLADLCVGNADTEMAAGQKAGVLQPDGSIKAEATFDVKHVADAIVHIAGLPLDVTVLNFNIMSVCLCAIPCVFSNLLYKQGFAHALDWQRLNSVHCSR